VGVAGSGDGDETFTEGTVVGGNTVDVAGCVTTLVGVQLARIAMLKKKIRTVHQNLFFNMRLFLR
jgi:hypothetical protein